MSPTRYFYLAAESRQTKSNIIKVYKQSVYGFGRMGYRLQTKKRYESVITKLAPLLIQEGGTATSGGVVSPGGLRNQPPRPAGHPS